MKKLIMLFVFFISVFISVSFVLADWTYNSRNIITSIKIYSDAQVIPTAQNGYIESATVNLTFFPKETNTQELQDFYTDPDSQETGKTLEFTWKKPQESISFNVKSKVKTTNTIMQVRHKIKFPLEDIPDDIAVYTKPSETIDSDYEGIVRLASELVKGEDDLYPAVFKIAQWTKGNINYNLSTLTAEVSQKASWVLQNKQGVCDELTSLFIALLRSVGIPARFVSGISYTNSELFAEKWGPHGWTEVYFPGYGWIPFDVTYGEYGWIDPTHIKFKDSIDSDEPATYYQWLGRNADLRTKKLEIKTQLLEKIGYYSVPLSIDAFVLKKSISFGSYNLVEADLENPNDFYYSTEFSLTKPKELKIIGSNAKSVLLSPNEKKKIFWILKLDKNLDVRYYYTFPLIVSTLDNLTSKTDFTSSVRENYVSFEEVQKISALLEEEKEKKYSGNVIFDCKPGKNEFYVNEDVKLNCMVKNTGNIFLDDADICFDSLCKKLSLGISQAKEVTFDINKSSIGSREIPVTLKNKLVSKVSSINFKIYDIPNIQIEDLDFPANVTYYDNFTVSFAIGKKSFSNPTNVDVVFSQDDVQKIWHISELTEKRQFALRFSANQLKYGENKYRISVNYYDGLKNKYSTHKEFLIDLPNAGLLQIMYLSLNNLAGISTRTLAIMLLAGTVAFILVVSFLFGKHRKI